MNEVFSILWVPGGFAEIDEDLAVQHWCQDPHVLQAIR